MIRLFWTSTSNLSLLVNEEVHISYMIDRVYYQLIIYFGSSYVLYLCINLVGCLNRAFTIKLVRIIKEEEELLN